MTPERDFRARAPGLVTQAPVCETQATTKIPSGDPLRAFADFGEDVVVRLCRLPVDLAAPLLRASLPTLTTQALLALIASTGEAHHRLIAERPKLDWRVIKALIRTNSDDVVAALAQNTTLSFDDEDQVAFARRALASAEVRAAVLAHEGLPVAKAQLRLHRGEDVSHSNLKLLALMRGGETAGFVREMAHRLKFDMAHLSRILASESPVPLALTLCAVGLDRAIFLHVLALWQSANGGGPRMTEGQKPLILSVFGLPAVEARRKLAVLMNMAH